MSGIVLKVSNSTLTLGLSSPVASGEANTVANVGAGAEVFRDQVAETFNLRSLTGINGLDAAVNGDEVEIDGNRDTAQWNADRLRGIGLSTDAPLDREHLVYNGSSGEWEPSSDGAGDILGPGPTVTDNAPIVWDGTTAKAAKEPDAPVDFLGQAITNVGTVDGRDVSDDGAALDGHIADTGNPHGTDLGNIGTGTLAELNAALSDANIPIADIVFGANSVSSTTLTRYLFPGFGDSTAQTSVIQRRMQRPGFLRNLYIIHNSPGGNGNPIVYTVRVNGAPTLLSVTMASTDSTGEDTSNSIAVAAGDLVDIEITKATAIGASPVDVVAAMDFAA
jgi:hypothetical protein